MPKRKVTRANSQAPQEVEASTSRLPKKATGNGKSSKSETLDPKNIYGTKTSYPRRAEKTTWESIGGSIKYQPIDDLTYHDKHKIKMASVFSGYAQWHYTDIGVFFLILSGMALLIVQLYYNVTPPEFEAVYHLLWDVNTLKLIGALSTLFLFILLAVSNSSRPVYLVDFSVLTPPDHLAITYEAFVVRSAESGYFNQENLDFQAKLLTRSSGLSQKTYFPPGICKFPPEDTMEAAREEARIAMFTCLDELFAKTGVSPQDIDILIVNCSLFCPTPSLSAMVINRYKMKSTTLNYSLGGMGCSAGLISIDLAKDLLQVHKNSLCVVVSTENITRAWYTGDQRDMLVANTIFRLGGAAMLLSNRWSDGWMSKLQLVRTVRVHKGADDEAYASIYQDSDPAGKIGVRLSQKLIGTVGDAIKENFTRLGPLILPITEQLKFFISFVGRKYLNSGKKQYLPDFKTAIDFFCIHAGGRAIIDGVQSNLKLSDFDAEASRWALWRYGNTSSASIWYEMEFLFRWRRLRKGNTILQIALGSGLKVNSAIWKVLRSGQTNPIQPPPNVDYVTGDKIKAARAKAKAEALKKAG